MSKENAEPQREGAAHQGKFSLPLISKVLMPCIGKSKQYISTKINTRHRVLEELIQATDFQDLAALGNRKNALENIANAIVHARRECPQLQPRLSAHIAGKIRELLIDDGSGKVFESSADLDCQRFFHDEDFQKSLKKACATIKRFSDIACMVMEKRDRRTIYRTTISELQREVDACDTDAAHFACLEKIWNGLGNLRHSVMRDAAAEFISFSLSHLPAFPQRGEFALYIQAHLPKFSSNAGVVIAAYLESGLQDEEIDIMGTPASSLHPML